MGALDGRVAIVTGAGRGLGREHALLLAAEGAKVVVNDVGSAADGSGADAAPADEVSQEVEALGGEAVASADDVGDWAGAQRVVSAAVEAFGDLHVLVNNAGIVRDRFLVNMREDEWDDVVRAHLKGHFATTRWAAVHWREQSKAGKEVKASVVNTSSTSGLLGNPGQANYAAAKAGVAALTQICALELPRYGVRCNAVVPAARTRLTDATPGLADVMKPPDDPEGFDPWHPANASPLVAYLATAECPANGRVLFVHGGKVQLFQPWTLSEAVELHERWTVADLAKELGPLL